MKLKTFEMNILEDPNKLEKRLIAKAVGSQIPLSASFELTPYCNLNCNMCFIRMNNKEIKKCGGIKDIHFWTETAEELKRLGTLFILLTGGEPLLYPHFNELYSTLKEMGFIVTINTNGTCITEKTITIFTRQKPRRVNVTLYGASAETYQTLCHNQTGLKLTIEGIKKLIQNNIDTKLNISVVKENAHEFEQMLEIGDSLNIPIIVNSYMFPCTRNTCQPINTFNSRLAPSIGGKIGALAMKHKKGNEYKNFFISEIKKLKNKPEHEGRITLSCRAGTSQVWINWQGKMTPCVMMESPSVNLTIHNVKEAWEDLKKQCQLLVPIEECKGCKLKSICQVCYASARLEKEHFGNLDYLCRFTNSELHTISALIDEKL